MRFSNQTGYKEITKEVSSWVWPMASLLLLNGLLSFSAWWPTVAVVPDTRIAPEFALLVLLLSTVLFKVGRLSARCLTAISITYCLLILGRYVDVVTPSLFGREINLYWDVPQLPRFLWVTAKGSPWWVTAMVILMSYLAITGFYKLVRGAIRLSSNAMLPYRYSPALWVPVILLSALAVANYAGVKATWPYVSKPVIPVYYKEFKILVDSLVPSRLNALLPKNTVVSEAMKQDSLLGALGKRDVMILFLESYGAVVFDHPNVNALTKASRDSLQEALRNSGRHVASAYFTSPTIGGASDLAHLSVLSGIDLSDPRKHDLLLTTNRPTLIDLFAKNGYLTEGMYHSVWWEWAEKRFYRFDNYIDGPALDYQGPEIGYWKIPDQIAMAKYEKMFAPKGGDAPRFSLAFTITSHFPFCPIPPYQSDWSRLLTPSPYDTEPLAATRAQEVNWVDMQPDYIRTINYTNQWLTDYFMRGFARERIVVMLGDHQPTATVTGENPSWDVPVYIITEDDKLISHFETLGFKEGMTPQNRQPLGKLSELTNILIEGFSGKTPQ